MVQHTGNRAEEAQSAAYLRWVLRSRCEPALPFHTETVCLAGCDCRHDTAMRPVVKQLKVTGDAVQAQRVQAVPPVRPRHLEKRWLLPHDLPLWPQLLLGLPGRPAQGAQAYRGQVGRHQSLNCCSAAVCAPACHWAKQSRTTLTPGLQQPSQEVLPVLAASLRRASTITVWSCCYKSIAITGSAQCMSFLAPSEKEAGTEEDFNLCLLCELSSLRVVEGFNF